MREVRMTFGEHLEELRRRIMVSLVWLTLSTSVCFAFYSDLVRITMEPHEHAVTEAMRKRHFVVIRQIGAEIDELMGSPGSWVAVFTQQIKDQYARSDIGSHFQRLAAELGPHLPAASRNAVSDIVQRFGTELSTTLTDVFSPAVAPVESRGYAERFGQLIEELREIAKNYRASKVQEWLGLGMKLDTILAPLDRFAGFLEERRKAVLASPPRLSELAAVIQGDTLIPRIADIYGRLRNRADELKSAKPEPIKVLKYTEAFMTSFKVSLIFGILLALPLVLYEAWKFVGAGLYEHEQRYVLIFFPFSIALFLCGALFGYKWMVPFGLQFLASWGAEFAELSFTLENYIGLFFTLTIVLGLVFQTPIVMIFLNKIEFVSAAGFASVRRYTYFGAVVFSTLVTPPDPLSWSLMAGPIMILYEIGIRICRLLERRKRRLASSGQ